MAEKLIPYFTPSWEKANRMLYTSPFNSRMKEAIAYVKADRWLEAKDIWLQIYDRTNNPKQQAFLANNFALAAEMQDDLELALDWAKKSEMIFRQEGETKNKEEIRRITSYISSLTKRMTDDLLLNNQQRF